MYQERKNAYEVHTKYLKVNKKVVSEVEEQVTPTFKTSFLYITCEMGVITKNTKLGTI
jgi:hypothetical protein